MSRFAYTVHASFRDATTADAFVAWLKGGHMAGVLAGGALTAAIVRLDPDSPGSGESERAVIAARVDVRYEFRSRADFDRYLTDYAPALRAEGLTKFGPAQGVAMSRSTGEIVS